MGVLEVISRLTNHKEGSKRRMKMAKLKNVTKVLSLTGSASGTIKQGGIG